MAWQDDDDFDFNYDDLSPKEKKEIEKEMKEQDRKLKNHPLFIKAKEISDIARSLVDTMSEEDKEMVGSMLLQDATILAPKIAGAMGSGSWGVCMQNASIIRYHAESLLLFKHTLAEFTKTDKDYIQLLRSEMEEFQKLFKEWASTFDKLENEDYEDEWGLFVRK